MRNEIYTIDGKSFELSHYGVKGMKWGRRKARPDYAGQARLARESSREWTEMARYAEQKGKAKRAAKYRQRAASDLAEAREYERQAGPKKSAKSNSSPKQKATSGKKAVKKTMQKVGQRTIKSSAKAASIGLQMVTQMIRTQQAYNTAGYMFDDLYR